MHQNRPGRGVLGNFQRFIEEVVRQFGIGRHEEVSSMLGHKPFFFRQHGLRSGVSSGKRLMMVLNARRAWASSRPRYEGMALIKRCRYKVLLSRGIGRWNWMSD